MFVCASVDDFIFTLVDFFVTYFFAGSSSFQLIFGVFGFVCSLRGGRGEAMGRVDAGVKDGQKNVKMSFF